MRLVTISLLSAVALCAQSAASRSLGDLSGRSWLALDARVWQSRGTAELEFHAFDKYAGNPVLRADKPWEGRTAYLYGTVLPQETGKGLRMWYHAHVDDKSLLASKHGYTNLYATSSDGFHWSKMALGTNSFAGAKENNIVLMRPDGPGESHSPNVIHTPWESDPNRRYKMVTYTYYDGYYGATSPDGTHWTDLPHRQILEDPGDVGNFVWDGVRGAYIGYPKVFETIRGARRRCVGFTETRTFERWPKARLIFAPDEEDDRGYKTPAGRTEFYGLSAFPYQTLYIGFLWIYRLETGDERIWPELVYSPDGVQWSRVPSPRRAVLPLGANGSWDDGMIFTANQPVMRDGQIYLYYGGFDGPHNAKNAQAAVGLATMRRDGFASLTAGTVETAITTVPLHGANGELLVNADVQGGELRAELLDDAGVALPGYEKGNAVTMRGNHTSHALRWNGQTALPATPFRVRFWLRQGAFYSFHVGEQAGLAPR